MSSPKPNADGHLRVVLAVTPSPDASCHILGSGKRGTVSKRDLRSDDDSGECTCKAEASLDDGPAQLVESDVTNGCVCPAFREHDCVASLDGFEDGTLIVSVAVPDREELTSVVAELRERGATVKLRRIDSSAVGSDRRVLRLDADGITEKQREAVQVAADAGYYETPREADLSELADQLGVSRSAVSQRLTAVETKLVEELVQAEKNGWPGPQPTSVGDR